MKEEPTPSTNICFQCKNGVYEDGLDLYDIRCEYDGEIKDENSSCDKYEFNSGYARINPRITEGETSGIGVVRAEFPNDDYKVRSEPYWLIPRDIDDYFRNHPDTLPKIKYDRLLESLPPREDLEKLIEYAEYRADSYGDGTDYNYDWWLNCQKKYLGEENGYRM